MRPGEETSTRTPPRVLPNTTYRTALTQEVVRKLQKAIDSPSQRVDCLRKLFFDVALEVDDRAKEMLYSAEGDAGVSGSRKCFYEVIAEHYAQRPEDGKAVLPLFVQLWSQSFASQIFSLLFYQWLFEIPYEQSDGLLRYTTAFVTGSQDIFWIDLQGNVRQFFSLYHYTMEAAMQPRCLNKFPLQSRRDLVLLLSRFFFFYEPVDRLDEFLTKVPLPSGFAGTTIDMFAIELTDQLQKVKVEPVLLHYLWSAKALQGKELKVTTSTRLKTALFSFTSPGGPMYPTRPVRHAAWDTLDCLFPVGKYSRLFISLLFRLLHPYHWPGSFWNFVVTFVTAVLDGFLALLVRVFQKIAGANQEYDDQHEE